jgi:hypothetical protein
MQTTTTKAAREVWLAKAVSELQKHVFGPQGSTIPKNQRVACGWPSVGALATSKRRIGEAWSSVASGDKHFEIFISPYLSKPLDVLATLAHECIHTAVGLECGHKGKFAKLAKAIGLEGKMTATHAGDALKATLAKIEKRLGKYPHASLVGMTNGRKKQGTRMVKAECGSCGYVVRTSMKWILAATPICPCEECDNFQETMNVELPEGDE